MHFSQLPVCPLLPWFPQLDSGITHRLVSKGTVKCSGKCTGSVGLRCAQYLIVRLYWVIFISAHHSKTFLKQKKIVSYSPSPFQCIFFRLVSSEYDPGVPLSTCTVKQSFPYIQSLSKVSIRSNMALVNGEG